MLRMDGKNVNFNGVSIVNDVQMASMSASCSGDNIYFSISIDSATAYLANSAAIDADVEAFKEAVIDAI